MVVDVKQAIHGRGEPLRVPERRKPHDLRGVILPKAEIRRHPFPQHADGMGIGNLLDHLQPRLAASSQPGGRRLPDPIDDEHCRGFQPGRMEGAGRVREMMRYEVKAVREARESRRRSLMISRRHCGPGDRKSALPTRFQNPRPR